jgi:hypothetical protein
MSRTAVRWIAPIAAAALAVGGGVAINNASADPTLPKKTPQQLLTAVAGADVPGLSGTVTEQADLGLPSLPTGSNDHAQADFSSLINGKHTLKVWASGDDKSRVSLLGTYGESSIIRNGNQAWVWSSKEKKAVHTVYKGQPKVPNDSSGLPATPQQAARQALDKIGPTTDTSVGRNVTVAGRSAYELVLTPKDHSSLVGEVAIAVDAKTSVPLRVEVTADGAAKPAFSVGFTDVDFSVPAARNFTFAPAKGTTVQQHQITPKTKPGARKQGSMEPVKSSKIVGKGWTSVLVAKASDLEATPGKTSGGSSKSGPADRGSSGSTMQQQLNALPKVSGSWGSGRLLSGSLFSAVITDNGRVAVGAVRPAQLYAALQK